MRSIIKILIIIVIILILFILPVFADEIEWVDPQEKTLRLKESFAREGFLIEASDFYANSSLISVYDSNNRLVTRNVTRINDYINLNDRLNITIMNLQEISGNISAGHGVNVIVDQWVRIKTRISGSPSLKVSIIPHKIEINNKTIIRHTFIPGSEIPINFSIKNEGKAVLKNLILEINSTLPLLSGEKLKYDLYQLEAGIESDVVTVRFKAPAVQERKIFMISARAKGNDVSGKAYQAEDSISVEVNPQIGKTIEIKKYVSEKIYMGDVAVVSISVRNNASRIIDNVSLTDSVPAGLEPVDTNLTWDFALGPNEQKSISYKVKPQKPGTFYLLPGSLIIEYQGQLDYNRKLSKLIVNGPYVVIVKSANIDNPRIGQNVSITVEARNSGDATAIVKLNDSVPADNSLPSEKYATVSNTMVLRPGNSAAFSYTINLIDTGRFTLPEAMATVLDQFLYQDERYTQKTSSNNLTINVGASASQPLPVNQITTPAQTVTPENKKTEIPVAATPKPASGFQGLTIFIIFFIIIMFKMKRSKFKR